MTERDQADRRAEARLQYSSLCHRLRSGERLSWETVALVLDVAGVDCERLVRDVLTNETATVAPGDLCAMGCGGRLVVYSSHRRGDYAMQYLKCNKCGYLPPRNKRSIPAGLIRRRKA